VIALVGALALVGATVAMAGSAGHHHRHRHSHHRPHPTVTILPSKGSERTVHPGLFGVNHRYAYDGYGMWDPSTPGVPSRFERRFDAARFRAMRFPGGTIANTYHWDRAIGPAAQRGLNVSGRNGEPLTNDFGPDEFGEFVAEHRLAAMMVANFGTGTAREAANWVEYMNAPVGTNPNGGVAWAKVRAANGHPQPYGVRNWEIGNEMFSPGQSYWMGTADRSERTRKYILGGTTRFPGQRVGTPWDHRDSAAVSDGSANQHFQVLYPPVDARQLFRLKVGDQVWTRVADLSGQPAGRHAYELDPATGKIAFGDGSHGAVPPRGKVVRASYVSGPHDGFVDFYREMKAADPSIRVGSSMHNGAFLSLMGPERPYDFVVMHLYSRRPPPGYANAGAFHDGIMRLASSRANAVNGLSRAVKAHAGAGGDGIPVVVSEYGMSFRGWPGPSQRYLSSMDQALYTALELQRWMQLGVPLAGKQALIDRNPGAQRGRSGRGDFGQQALIGSRPNYIESATARAFRLLAPAAGQRMVHVGVQGNPTRRIYTGKPLTMLSATATKASDGSLYLIVVNKDRVHTMRASIVVKGSAIKSAIVHRLVGPSFLAFNTVAHPQRVSIHANRTMVGSRRLPIRLRPHSLTTVELRRGESEGGG
jgi:alpha-N-arabinofuranosidase